MTKSRGIRVRRGTRALWVEANQGRFLCECGCGQPVRLRAEHYPAPPKYLHGHNGRKPPKPIEPGPPCECGCGQRAKLGNRFVNGHNGRGQTRPADVREAISVAMTGERNHRYGKRPPQWKGYTTNRAGYILRWAPEHPHAAGGRYVMEHRLVMEQHLRDTDPSSRWLEEVGGTLVLRRDVEVHHVDEDKANNAIENLRVLTKAEHARLHDSVNRRRA